MPKKIEISHRTIVFTILFLALLWVLYTIRDIVLLLFVSLLIMAILNPLVTRFSKYKIPRAVSVLVVYILVIGVISVTLAGILPPLIDQTTNFVNGLSRYIERLGLSAYVSDQLTRELIFWIGSIPGQAAKFTISLLSNVVGIFTVLIFAFYLLLARDKLDEQLGFLFGEKGKKKIGKLIDELEVKLGGWARGQLTLMVLVGLFTFIGLRLLGIPFALPLSILAGLLEIIPYLGPIIAAIPAVIIGLGISPVMGLATAALAFLVQQFENYVFVPKVMEKSVGVNPILTLLSLAIGFKLAGIVGVLISIPVVLTTQVVAGKRLLSR